MEEGIYLGLHTVPGGKSIISEGDMAAGGLGSKLRDHIFNHRCEGEGVNSKWGGYKLKA